jgi:protein-disulfide isomerase
MKNWLLSHKAEAISFSISAIILFFIIIKVGDNRRETPTIDDITILSAIQEEERNIILGDKKAPLTMTLYYNYSCPSCNKFMSGAFLQLKKEFIDNGLLYAILKPVDFSENEINLLDLQAILCMDKLGLFDPMNEYLTLRREAQQSTEVLLNEFIAINNELLYCIESGESLEQIQRNNRQLKSFSTPSTPTIVLNAKIYKGLFPYATFKRILERELK